MTEDGRVTQHAPQASAHADAAAEWDIVLKGGITSGIVYPSAIASLATHYRLRSILHEAPPSYGFRAAAQERAAHDAYIELPALADR